MFILAVAGSTVRGAGSKVVMKTSTDRILTTHVGSLIRPQALQDIMRAKQVGSLTIKAAYESCLKESIDEVVRRQAEIGVDVRAMASSARRSAGTNTSSSA
jgi:methionine synthase II (cobalamin-independent)